MLRKSFPVQLLLLCLLICITNVAHARQNMAERAQGQYKQRASKQAHASSQVYPRSNTSDYRYYNNKTSGALPKHNLI